MIKTKQYLFTSFDEIPAYTFSMKVKHALHISYIARRGYDNEEGSVQRILNRGRINKIKDYVLEGNQFFSSFILNWTNSDIEISITKSQIQIPLLKDSAQVLDGQHRLAGLQEAFNNDPKIGENEIIVTVCQHLTTKEAAQVFLNINTEQKPAPKSLIFDLFGEVEDDRNHAINRATDIARLLNESETSPLFDIIRFPGSKRVGGTVELSTFVSALKKHVEPNGTFASLNLTSLERQAAALENYFLALKTPYERAKIWSHKSKNPFFRASGLNGALQFFAEKLAHRCAARKSFRVKTISEIMALNPSSLLKVDELRGMDGKSAQKLVFEFLGMQMKSAMPDEDEYAF